MSDESQRTDIPSQIDRFFDLLGGYKDLEAETHVDSMIYLDGGELSPRAAEIADEADTGEFDGSSVVRLHLLVAGEHCGGRIGRKTANEMMDRVCWRSKASCTVGAHSSTLLQPTEFGWHIGCGGVTTGALRHPFLVDDMEHGPIRALAKTRLLGDNPPVMPLNKWKFVFSTYLNATTMTPGSESTVEAASFGAPATIGEPKKNLKKLFVDTSLLATSVRLGRIQEKEKGREAEGPVGEILERHSLSDDTMRGGRSISVEDNDSGNEMSVDERTGQPLVMVRMIRMLIADELRPVQELSLIHI